MRIVEVYDLRRKIFYLLIMADSSAEQEALKRKERLKALKAKREARSDAQGNSDSQTQSKNEKPKLKFRSYNPQTEELKEKKLPKAKPEEVEPHIKEQLEATKDTNMEEVNLANLAPRKIDWDLKRDIAKKLEKLERRTQRAIAELVQERIKAESDGVDLASAVATAGQDEKSYDSD